MEYENNTNNHIYDRCDSESTTQLLKTKEIINLYPALTLYSINKAIKDGKLSVIKIGNLNYFTKENVENFIKSQTIHKPFKM